jgi:hypothetical protein
MPWNCVKTDRLLASVELAQALNAGASQKQIVRASREFVSGDQAVAGKLYVAAILHYRDCWKSASHLIR